MSERFSLYIDRESPVHQRHPLTKLVLACFCLVTGVAAPGIGGYAVFLFLLLPLAMWARILHPFLNAAIKAVLPFAISLFLVQGLFWPEGTPLVGIGPISLKQEGLAFAIRSTGRIFVILASFLFLSFTTRPDMLMQALRARGVPRSITYIILTTIQIVPRFQAKANTILDAQRSRGLETEGNVIQRIRALLPLIQPLVLGSIVDIEERTMALEVRAFARPGPKTTLYVLTDLPQDILLRRILILATVFVVVLRIWLF